MRFSLFPYKGIEREWGKAKENVGKVWNDEEKATWKGQREMESSPHTSLLWLMNLTCV